MSMAVAPEQSSPENLPAKKKASHELHEFWDTSADAAHLLGVEIIKGVEKSGEGYHKMALIPPGGFMPALVLMKPFGFSNHHVFNLNVTHEKGSGELKVSNPPSVDEVEGLNILLLDDFWRTGKLLTHAKEILLGRRARKVDIAVLHAIPLKEGEEGPRPDFFAVKADAGGVSYGWDRQSVKFEALTPIRIPTLAEVISVQDSQANLAASNQL